ncbi:MULTISPECIES: CPBP family intramembrane glutamic endopeptidase [unclassified Lentimicrobium]|uniref:CPBP family intramembrane glutamic endopeptidase n=1 Tax=unclassified Lentimicrobium TaxID=2677434 RepID=UPI0015569F95|nr:MULTISPECIES: CPBP family intramembrane glutamic endopeptidase [unclassified Lentimicrobium]NPD46640.1 CPBP family intramembrane metalloprotease [Lentimicrobium sp. S6]NPD84765.1 CPBP family intramembrane metalloprotease [Lentimicrobium sp. L6]
MDIRNYIGITSLTEERKKPLIYAFIFFILYICASIFGSEIQKILNLDMKMGWVQQIVSAIIILLFAFFFKAPRQLLALVKPKDKNWLKYTVFIGVIFSIWNLITSVLSDDPSVKLGLEYYLFELTMPSFSEEICLRGAVFGFVLYYVKQSGLSNFKIWIIVIIQVLPFAIAHLLHVESFGEGLRIFLFTFSAGLGLSWLRIKTGSIFPSMIAHSIINVLDNILGYLL